MKKLLFFSVALLILALECSGAVSSQPTGRPSWLPSNRPHRPSEQPTGRPSVIPSERISQFPTEVPSEVPTELPTYSCEPTSSPTQKPAPVVVYVTNSVDQSDNLWLCDPTYSGFTNETCTLPAAFRFVAELMVNATAPYNDFEIELPDEGYIEYSGFGFSFSDYANPPMTLRVWGNNGTLTGTVWDPLFTSHGITLEVHDLTLLSFNQLTFDVSYNQATLFSNVVFRFNYGSSNMFDLGGTEISFVNCLFLDNSIYSFSGGTTAGSLMHLNGGVHLYILDCEFSRNFGATTVINVEATLDVTIDGSQFIDNTCNGNGCVANIGTVGALTVTNSKFIGNGDSYAGTRLGSTFYAAFVGSFTIDSCYFSGSSSNSGTIYINPSYSYGSLSVTNTDFHNEATALYLAIGQMTTYISNCQFTDNRRALVFIYHSQESTLTIEDCTFDGHTDTALQFTPPALSPVNLVIENCEFTNNFGYSGGAISFGSNLAYAEISDCLFANNSANDGGAIYVGANIAMFTFENVKFLNNSAVPQKLATMFLSLGGRGGAVYFDSGIELFNFTQCQFESNFAVNQGGAIYIRQMNKLIILQDTLIANNTATSGGALYMLNLNRIVIITSVFDGNSASHDGGAILLNEENTFTMFKTEIVNNRALKSGGGMAILSSNDQINIQESTIMNNFATVAGAGMFSLTDNNGMKVTSSRIVNNVVNSYGGGVFIGIACSDVTFRDTQIHGNKATFGGGVYVELLNEFVTFSGCDVKSNSATYGGGMYLSGSQLEINSTVLRDNTAIVGGGALYAISANTLTITESTIENNLCGNSGGGLYFTGSQTIVISGTLIQSNSAELNGGGMYALSSTDFVLSEVEFVENAAIASGGGVFLDIVGDFLMTDSSVNNNTAVIDGGGIFANAASFGLILSGSIFDNNYANGLGGAVASESESTLLISDCSFTQNFATSGAAVSVIQLAELTAERSTFSSNAAKTDGGAMRIIGTGLTTVSLENCQFDFNQAPSGGAVEISSLLNISVAGNLFEGNQAVVGGAVNAKDIGALYSKSDKYLRNIANGTDGGGIRMSGVPSQFLSTTWYNNSASRAGAGVYWDAASGMAAPTFTQCNFSRNHASYGADRATEGTHAVTSHGDRVVMIDQFSGSVAPLQFLLLDYYDSVVNTQSSSILTVAANSQNFSCSSGLPVAVGETSVVFNEGVATFDALQLACSPKGTMDLEITYLGDNHDVTASLEVKFRTCSSGEYFSANKCMRCPIGSFSLHNNTDLQVTSCHACPGGAQYCEGDTIIVKSGHWRISPDAYTPLSCPYPTGCNSTSLSGEAICMEGYEGPLCAVCSENYYYDSTSNGCQYCEAGHLSTFAKVVLSLLVVAVALVFGLLYYVRSHVSPDDTSEAMEMSLADAAFHFSSKMVEAISAKHGMHANFAKQKNKMKKFASRVQAKFKIYVTLYQIISGLPYVLNLKYPSIFTKMANVFQFAQFNFTQNLGLECRFKYDYVDLLLVSTIGPAIAIAALFTVQYVHTTFFTKHHDAKSLSKLKANYFFAFLVFTYLILPAVSTNIFRTFSRENVDPDGVTGMDQWYMTSDYRIRTNSARYRFASIWAGVMIIVYPVGIPAYYYYVLRQARKEIMNRHLDPEESEEDDDDDDGSEHGAKIVHHEGGNETELVALKPNNLIVDDHHAMNDDAVQVKPEEGKTDEVPPKSDDDSAEVTTYDHVLGLINDLDFEGAAATDTKGQDLHDTGGTDLVANERAHNYTIGFSEEEPDEAAPTADHHHEPAKNAEPLEDDSEDVKEVLRPIKFLFQAYEREYWYWEVIETVQRLLLTGVLVLIVQGSALQIVIAMVISILFTKFYGLCKPFISDDDDFEKELTQWQIFAAFFLALLIKTNALAEFNGIISVGLVLSSVANLFVDLFSQLNEIWKSLGMNTLLENYGNGMLLFVARTCCVGKSSTRIAVTTTAIEEV